MFQILVVLVVILVDLVVFPFLAIHPLSVWDKLQVAEVMDVLLIGNVKLSPHLVLTAKIMILIFLLTYAKDVLPVDVVI